MTNSRAVLHAGTAGGPWPRERALSRTVWRGAWRRAARGSSAAKRKLASAHERLTLERATQFTRDRLDADLASLLGWAYLGLVREIDRLAARAANPSVGAFPAAVRRSIDAALAKGYRGRASRGSTARAAACPRTFMAVYLQMLASSKAPPSISQVLLCVEEEATPASTWRGLPLRPDAPSARDALASFALSYAIRSDGSRDIPALPSILALIGERERLVLELRHGWSGDGGPPLTLEEIGRRLRLTRERVRQLALRGYARLRRAAAVWG